MIIISFYMRSLKTDKSINLKHNQTEENMNCLSPSILSADYSILGEQLKQLDEAGAVSYTHLDVYKRQAFMSCRACGFVVKCPHCDVSLSEHSGGVMVCHYCGYRQPVPKVCPSLSLIHI